MDIVTRQLFSQLWIEFQNSLTLTESIKSFLYHLYTKFVIKQQLDEFCQLAENNRTSLFQQLTKIISSRSDGFDILMDYVKNNISLKELHKKYENPERRRQIISKEIESALKYGNIPTTPKFYIERTNVMKQLKAQLLDMDNKKYTKVNIFGMDGCGKSTLVAECLRDEEILSRAKYKVYWIDASRFNEVDLLDRMYKLYHKVQINDNSLTNFPTDKPNNIDIMKDRLLNLFLKSDNDNAIIVLDNLEPSIHLSYITHFSVCKLVIISWERLDLEQERVEHFHYQDAFTYTETMDVFKMALNNELMENQYLREIIDWCKGDPTTIILCANHMIDRRQKLINSVQNWKSLKQELCKDDSKITKKRNRTIELRLNDLEYELKNKYMDLAIFAQDVNITSNVLCLLWNIVSVENIEEIMLSLCNKSFAVREFNDSFDFYVYGVNPIYLNYLKSINYYLKKTHRRLIYAYQEKYIDYHNFPDDNYIYQYIGYHLKEAQLVYDFKIFMDLKFIGAKIRATGIADILSDFEVYEDFITQQVKENETCLIHLSKFIETYGHNLELYPRTHIVQSALQLSEANPVHQLALKEIKNNPVGLYFYFVSPQRNKYHIHQLSIKNNLKVACFTRDNSDYLLVGTETGDIQLWDQHYDRVLQEFKGHIGPIIYLRAIDNKFLSISTDGVAKLWTLDDNSRRNSNILNVSNNSDSNVPSPACIKQKNYQHFFGNNFNIDNDCLTYTADKDAIISADFGNDLLVVGTQGGELLLWSNDQLVFGLKLDTPIISVQFSISFSYVYLATGTEIYVFNTMDGSFLGKKCQMIGLLALHTVESKEDKFIAVLKKSVVLCNIKHEDAIILDIQVIITVDDNICYTCSSMTDKYLVIGSNDNKIHMWDLQKKSIIEELDPQNGNVICIDATINPDDNSIEILLTGFQNKTLKLWHINPEENTSQQCEIAQDFAAYWQPTIQDFARAIVTKRKLSVYYSNITNDITTNDDIVKIISFKNSFVYALKDGKVYMINDTEPKEIMDLQSEITYLEALDDTIIVAAASNGTLFVYYNGNPKKLSQGNGCKIKNAFNMYNKLVVLYDKKICYWDYTFEHVQVLYANVETEDFKMSCLSSNKNLCVIYKKGFKILTIDANLKVSTTAIKFTQHVITACCFSFDNKYLALGTEEGDIEIWVMENLQYDSTLVLHNSPIQFLTFSPTKPILLSLAEQMAWWHIKPTISQINTNSNSNRRSFRSRSNSGKKVQAPLLKSFANLRLANEDLPLSAIKLHGTSASHIVHNENFNAFFCIDNLGGVYNLREVDLKAPIIA